eukprot:TRINITY_DN6602_c0_g1_i8.p1 TRINITY_DN6602_c0_g1~~TRINITY_DN6602_c0_g1_i8.p1  ORF type:complete len:401 (-),score=47.68 TRINITY_DN6602_c0_g1_i8:244-1446(-)
MKECNLSSLKESRSLKLDKKLENKMIYLKREKRKDAMELENVLNDWSVQFSFSAETFVSGNQSTSDQDVDWHDQQIVNMVMNCPWDQLVSGEKKLKEQLKIVEEATKYVQQQASKRDLSLSQYLRLDLQEMSKQEKEHYQLFQDILEKTLEYWKPGEHDFDYMSKIERNIAQQQTEELKTQVQQNDVDEQAVEEELERLSMEPIITDPLSTSDIIEFRHDSDRFDMMASRHQLDALDRIRKTRDLWTLEPLERALFIGALLQNTKSRPNDEVSNLLQQYQAKHREINEIEEEKSVKLLQQAKVVGMTVTGASIRASLLEKLQPSVVLVEEAGEVLEPQLVAPLGNWTQHLIQIGDHKQLRPLVKSEELKRGPQFDTSMLERLIEMCKVSCHRSSVSQRIC